MSTPSRQDYLDTWMDPILTISMPLERYGIPLLAAVLAFYLITNRSSSVKEVMTGFVLGGLVLGFGIALINWGVTNPRYRATMLEYTYYSLQRGGYFAGAGLVGTLCGEAVRRHSST